MIKDYAGRKLILHKTLTKQCNKEKMLGKNKVIMFRKGFYVLGNYIEYYVVNLKTKKIEFTANKDLVLRYLKVFK